VIQFTSRMIPELKSGPEIRQEAWRQAFVGGTICLPSENSRLHLLSSSSSAFDPELAWRLLPRSPARLDRAWAKARLTPAVGLARPRSSSGWALPSWVEVGFAGGAGQAQITRRTRHDSRNFRLE
jgi:hypothetical protein